MAGLGQAGDEAGWLLPAGLRAVRALMWGCAGLPLLIATMGLAWHGGVGRDLLPRWAVMQAPAAMIVSLLAISLLCLGSGHHLRVGRFAAGLAAGSVLLALVTRTDAGAGIAPAVVAVLEPLPALACVAALMLALAMLGLRHSGRWSGLAVVLLAFASGLAGLLAVLGHLFDAPSLYQLSGAAPVVPTGALSLLLLSCGVWCAQPDRGPVGLLLADDAGGASLRRLLPAVLLIAPVLALLQVASERSGLLGVASGGALSTAALMVIFGGLLAIDAAWLGRLDRRQRATERRLASLAADLERQVAERTRELSQSNAELHREVVERQRAEALFRGVFDGVPDAVLVVDADARIELANERSDELFGYGRGALVGLPISQFVPPAIAEQHAKRWRAFLAMPQPYALFGEQGDVSLRRADGSDMEAEVTLGVTSVGGQRRVIVSVRDISARVAAQRSADAANARYRSLVDNLPIGIFVSSADPDGHLLEANPAMLRLLEADSLEDLLFRPVASFHAVAGHHATMLAAATQGGGLQAEEFDGVTLRGRHFRAALMVAPRQVGSERVWDGVLEDITARQEAERNIHDLNAALAARAVELEAINQELEAFSYSVSHDLRAPLRAIDGFSRILEQQCGDRLDADNRQRLARVRHNAQHMGALIDDLLNLARVARAPLQWREVDLSELAADIVHDLSERDPDREVTAIITPDLRAWGDARLLRLALQNLLDNAWKFTVHAPSAQIEFDLVDAGEPEPCFVVRDNGAGFDMAYADKLFGAFQRLHGIGEFPGTGIGLATVQRIIHKHGGRIWAHAQPQQGAGFYFTLPQENPHG